MSGPPKCPAKSKGLDAALAAMAAEQVPNVGAMGGTTPLLNQVYRTLLCLAIWTKQGGVWYNPEYPDYSDDIESLLDRIEKHVK